MAKRLFQAMRDLFRPRVGAPSSPVMAEAGVVALPHARLAVFGKHPGWNDHIDDQGSPSEHMLGLKRLLYIEGIGGCIDSGTWEAAPRTTPGDVSRTAMIGADERLLDGFDHAFVWQWPDRLFVGRLVNSSDGKGRRRYPLIACVECPHDWSIEPTIVELLPVLEACLAECRATKEAAGVKAATDKAQSAVDRMPPVGKSGLAPATITGTAALEQTVAGRLAADGSFDGKTAGLLSVLYHITREVDRAAPDLDEPGGPVTIIARLLGSDLPPGTVSADKDKDSGQSLPTLMRRALQLRVPRGDASAERDLHAVVAASVDRWIVAIAALYRPDVPVLAICPMQEPWIDLIAGIPTAGRELSCLRLKPIAMPLTSDIPYSLPDGFAARFGLQG